MEFEKESWLLLGRSRRYSLSGARARGRLAQESRRLERAPNQENGPSLYETELSRVSANSDVKLEVCLLSWPRRIEKCATGKWSKSFQCLKAACEVSFPKPPNSCMSPLVVHGGSSLQFD